MFHQLDAEIIGTDAPAADVELLVLADQLLRELGISDGITLQLNTLGDGATRDAWRAALVAHFEARRADALGPGRTARKALGLNEILAGDVETMKRRSRNYARRQLTWMRKIPNLTTIDRTALNDAETAMLMGRKLLT